MKEWPILFERLGENSDTPPDPVDVWRGQVDLDEEGTYCLSYDDNRPVRVKRYEVRLVTLPDWLDPKEWIRDSVTWKWVWGSGAEAEWPEAWQRGLANMGEVARYACIQLLKTYKAGRFRSDFRRSLAEHLVEWLETPVTERKHGSPFSRRQWECLYNAHVRRRANQVSSQLYWDRHPVGKLLSKEEAYALIGTVGTTLEKC